MKVFSSRRRKVVATALILLALFLLRPGASRLKSRIVLSISAAVGRPVDIGSVHLQLLPRPGFDLENLVVYDDPAFGAEPMLRASEVTAALRLTSLLRGRLEIARLELTEPSLNLVHAEGGRWNLEALLERTAHTPLAPTGKAKSERRPGFPYIEATSARINFKSGLEKKPYALTNADFSLWQDSENAWGVRLKAQPLRTDLNLNDTGLLQVNGQWQRADALRDTPLQFSVEWNRAQLGQFTKFFTGNDQGWRGEILLDLTLTGTPEHLQIASNASVQDFRRYDITGGSALRLTAHCDGEYGSVTHRFRGIECSAPAGNGIITLKGEMGLPGSQNYDLALAAENVPASAVVALAQRTKKDLAQDLAASGTVHGSISIAKNTGTVTQLRVEGRGEIADFHLTSATNKAEIGPETIPFLLASEKASAGRISRAPAERVKAQTMRTPDTAHLEFGPFAVGVGRGSALTARGSITPSGYNISLAGEAEIAKVLRVARMLGLPALQPAAEGTAQVDLQVAGSWAGRSNGVAPGLPGPQITGTAKLHNVRIAVRSVGGPVEIGSADLRLSSSEVRVENLKAKAADTSWTGWLEMPRGCGTPDACQVHFNLNASQTALHDLIEWVSPRPKERPWYRVLEPSSQTGPSFLASLRASGQVSTDRFQFQGVTATHVSAKVSLGSATLRLTELNADFLDGKYRGEWVADFSEKPALCSGSAALTGISLENLADAMKDSWIAGVANAKYEVEGACSGEFWSTADGTLEFDMKEGKLPHVMLREDAQPLQITHFAGQARLHAGKIELKDAMLNSPDGQFQLSGTASLQRELEFKLARLPFGASAPGYTISGTLEEPRVVRSSTLATQARLKPEVTK